MNLEKIQKAFKELPEKYLVLFIVSASDYLDSDIAILKEAFRPGMGVVYVSMNRPYSSLTKKLEAKGIPLDKVFFVDCITKSVGEQQKAKNCLFIESPQDLTKIGTAISQAVKALPTKGKFLFLDALTTLLIYNSSTSVAKFLHFLTGKIRILELNGIVLSIEKDLDPNVAELIIQFMDKTVDLTKK